jgi:hypothetical protein
MALGQHLYSIEIVYRWGAEEKIERRKNLTEEEMGKFRRNVLVGGMAFMVERGHWKVVCPIDILSIDIHEQSGYFHEI